MKEELNWLVSANKMADSGDPRGMRGCAREIFELDATSADGPAVMAEAALYMGNREEAEVLAQDALELDAKNLRAKMVLAFLAGTDFKLIEQIKSLNEIIRLAEEKIRRCQRALRELTQRERLRGYPGDEEKNLRDEAEALQKINGYILRKCQGNLADALYLAAEPEEAAKAIRAMVNLSEDESKAELYSKYLFMLNYRTLAPNISRQMAAEYPKMLGEITPYAHEHVQRTPNKRLRIGYISPDFRLHAVAYFLAPLLRDFDQKNFAVYCYSTGKSDAVTKRLQHFPVKWRDIRARSPRTAARLIAEDKIDILFDLAGHSQDNNLPIMAYRPAPLQITGIGYMNTTGLGTIDYFLADSVTVNQTEIRNFIEKPLRLNGCHLCYDPGAVRAMPPPSLTAPVTSKGYINFGSFNNLAKLTDEVLCMWRTIMDKVRNSRLTLKGKMCSIPDGRELLQRRLDKLGFDLSRLDFRPYSPDYLENYRDIDIALDTAPYNGGLTTCEALFMGVPVVTWRGGTHGSRFGASILTAADLAELIADSQMEYIKKVVQLSANHDILNRYHRELREHVQKSRLMDGKAYMRDLEEKYRAAWQKFCN